MFVIVLEICLFLGIVLFVFVFGIFILFFGDIIVLLCFILFCARPVGRARFRFVLGVFSCGFVLWEVCFLVLLFGFICVWISLVFWEYVGMVLRVFVVLYVSLVGYCLLNIIWTLLLFLYVCVEVVRFLLLFLLSCVGLCVCIFCIMWVEVLRGINSLTFFGVFGCSR